MRITAADYKRVRAELRETCPIRAFPAIADNCWVDSTMYGLTYAPDIGKVLRAALLGCLKNLEAAGVSDTTAFYPHVETWGLEPIWKTYVVRMLLYLLLREKAAEELTCPLITRWVEDFRKRTFAMVGAEVGARGGLTLQAILAILTALTTDDDIVIQQDNIKGKGDKGAWQFYGKEYKPQPFKDLRGYEPRIAHLIVKREGANVGHVVVTFVCNNTVYLFDNNTGLFQFPNLHELPTNLTITNRKIEKDGQLYLNKITYSLTTPGGQEEVSKQFGPVNGRPTTTEMDTLTTKVTLYTRDIYNRVRRGEDILATMLGAPTVQRLTVATTTPRIADVKSGSPTKMSSRSSRSSRSSKSSDSMEFVEEKGRITKFASCVRQMAATTPYKRSMLFNAPDWSDHKPEEAIVSQMSSKFRTLLETIRRVDEEDMERHGQKFKHFIFTDLRNGAYGAKAIATFLAIHGYELLFKTERGFRRRKVLGPDRKPIKGVDGKPVYRMEATKKLKITLGTHQPIEGGSDRVGLLQGNPIWKSQLGVDVRKQMLGIFNSRPDNIHGEQIRFMILDSKFKEGIDLYDVKYVHLMEPAITEADLKQAIGRATRFCGQRGLQFVPNVGWKLNVFLYETHFANNYPFRTSGTAKFFDAHKYMMAHSGLDLGLLEMTRNLTVLAIKSAVDYDLTYKINNFKMQTELRDLTDLKEAIVLSVNPQTGGVTKVLPEVNRAKCMPRSNKFFPFTVPRIREALKARGISAAKAPRKELCALLEANEEVMQDLITGRHVSLKKPTLPTNSPILSPSTPGSLALTADSVIGVPRTPYYELFPVPSVSRRLTKAELEEMPDLADFFAAHELLAEANYMANRANFTEFQEFIRKRYAEYKWEAPVVKSACETAQPAGEPVQFSKSQDFVRHYLTPASPFRGLLAWHSVGTGKTCMAVATATSEFEKQGYSILWVTRNSLMADVWKNVFGAVCSIPIQEYLRSGKKLPVRQGTRKRLLSKAWFDPISYRTLENALYGIEKQGKLKQTQLGQLLRTRNGTDPLRKTFLIIDEVHKLLDGDLKASEKADFEKIAAMIHNSYKVSGADSVKVLLMTATPITDNPEGLFRLLNLLIPEEKQRLPTVDEFRAEYTRADGTITKEGEAFFQSHSKGLISYLNREFDPTAFAQPEFHRVRIPASGADLLTDKEIVSECLAEEAAAAAEAEADEPVECDVDKLKEEEAMELEGLQFENLSKKELAERKRTLKAEYRERIQECKERIKSQKQAKKDGVKRVAVCLAAKAKTRKAAWKFSQQKAAKKCFGKHPYGKAPKFTTIAALKKLAKGDAAPATRRSSIRSAKRSLSPNKPFYHAQRRTRKVQKSATRNNTDNNLTNNND